jgi:predicted  nucleic acid-binding Zn-ribbon protein
MHPDVVKLLDLQEKDLVLLEVDTRLAAVLADIDKLDEAIRQLTGQAEAAHRTAAEAARRQQELEAKIESYRKIQDRRRQRLELVRPGKEVAAMMAELDLSRSVLAKEESEWARLGDQATELVAAAEQAERAVVDAREAQTPERDELARRQEAVELERAAALEARDAAAARVERSLRQRYERLRATRATRPVVALDGVACGACFTAVPLNRRTQIRSGTRIDWCEACGVILYANDQSG